MIKRVSLIILGLILITIGLFGILIPIMPGWTPLIFGIALIHPATGNRMKNWLGSKIEKRKKRH